MRATTPVTVVALALLAACTGPGDDPSPAPPATATAPGDSPGSGGDTGAGGAPGAAERVVPGAPEGFGGEDTEVLVGDDPRHLLVVTLGSSSCPVVPTDVAWDADAAVLHVELSDGDQYDGPCTTDLVPTTSVVRLPDDAPDAPDLTVEVEGRPVPVG